MSDPSIIVAMDVPDRAAFDQARDRLPASCPWLKIGLELFCREGPNLVVDAARTCPNLFLDLKLHDIPRTVDRSVTSLRHLPVALTTLHASGGEAMLKAAVEAASGSNLRLLAVTVLTSLDAGDLRTAGIDRSPRDQVLALASLAQACGVDGVVASPQEAAAIRRETGKDFLIVTPGIRPASAATGDQKRVATPRDAVLAGATHLVVGRPILGADNPVAAYAAIGNEVREAAKT